MKKDEQIKFISMRAQGDSYQSIAEALSVSKSTAIEWGKKYADEIKQARLEYIDDVVKENNLASVGRIKALSRHLGKITEALADVDYRVLPPDKLMKLYIDVTTAMRQEAGLARGQNQSTTDKMFDETLWAEPNPFTD